MKYVTTRSLILLTCAIALLVPLSRYFPNKILDGLVIATGFAILLSLACFICWVLWSLLLVRRKHFENRARADKWKLQISSIADNTEWPTHDKTFSRSFDDLCYFEDDDFLNQVFKELEAMPAGERIMAKAYKAVHDKNNDA